MKTAEIASESTQTINENVLASQPTMTLLNQPRSQRHLNSGTGPLVPTATTTASTTTPTASGDLRSGTLSDNNIYSLSESSKSVNAFQRAAAAVIGLCCTLIVILLVIATVAIKCHTIITKKSSTAASRMHPSLSNARRRPLPHSMVTATPVSKIDALMGGSRECRKATKQLQQHCNNQLPPFADANNLGLRQKSQLKLPSKDIISAIANPLEHANFNKANRYNQQQQQQLLLPNVQGDTTSNTAESTAGSLCMSTSSDGLNYMEPTSIACEDKRRMLRTATGKHQALHAGPSRKKAHGSRSNGANNNRTHLREPTARSRRCDGVRLNGTLRQRLSGTISSRLSRLHLSRLLSYFAMDYAEQQERQQELERRDSTANFHLQSAPSNNCAIPQGQLTVADLLSLTKLTHPTRAAAAACKTQEQTNADFRDNGQTRAQVGCGHYKAVPSQQAPPAPTTSYGNFQLAPRYAVGPREPVQAPPRVKSRRLLQAGANKAHASARSHQQYPCQCSSCVTNSWLSRHNDQAEGACSRQCNGRGGSNTNTYNQSQRCKLPFGTASSVLRHTSSNPPVGGDSFVGSECRLGVAQSAVGNGARPMKSNCISGFDCSQTNDTISQVDNEHHLLIDNLNLHNNQPQMSSTTSQAMATFTGIARASIANKQPLMPRSTLDQIAGGIVHEEREEEDEELDSSDGNNRIATQSSSQVAHNNLGLMRARDVLRHHPTTQQQSSSIQQAKQHHAHHMRQLNDVIATARFSDLLDQSSQLNRINQEDESDPENYYNMGQNYDTHHNNFQRQQLQKQQMNSSNALDQSTKQQVPRAKNNIINNNNSNNILYNDDAQDQASGRARPPKSSHPHCSDNQFNCNCNLVMYPL